MKIVMPEDYKKAREMIEEIREREEKYVHNAQEELEKIRYKYQELMQNLEHKKRQEEKKIIDKRTQFEEKIKSEINPHYEQITQFKKILTFMRIQKDKRDLHFEVYKYDYPRDEHGEVMRVQRGNCLDYPEKIKIPYNAIEVIKNDKYAIIKIFVVENDKPKNKFSLVVVGKSIFNEDLFTQRRNFYSYHLSCDTDYVTVRLSIIDRPTREELLQYLEKHKKNILKDYLAEHDQLERDYEKTIQLTNNKQWELAYWEDKKNYYENHYSNGIETEEYKEVLKQIKILEG